jgi:hypothetical protein
VVRPLSALTGSRRQAHCRFMFPRSSSLSHLGLSSSSGRPPMSSLRALLVQHVVDYILNDVGRGLWWLTAGRSYLFLEHSSAVSTPLPLGFGYFTSGRTRRACPKHREARRTTTALAVSPSVTVTQSACGEDISTLTFELRRRGRNRPAA